MGQESKAPEESTVETEAKLIDNIEVCRLLGVKPDTWRKRVQSGSAPMPFSRMGNRSYYRAADVRHYLRKGSWPARVRFRNQERLEVPAE
jgi:hypothetical protein